MLGWREAPPQHILAEVGLEVEYTICRGAKPPSEVLWTELDGVLGAEYMG